MTLGKFLSIAKLQFLHIDDNGNISFTVLNVIECIQSAWHVSVQTFLSHAEGGTGVEPWDSCFHVCFGSQDCALSHRLGARSDHRLLTVPACAYDIGSSTSDSSAFT